MLRIRPRRDCSRICRGSCRSGSTALDNNQNNLIDEIGEGGWDATLLQANHTHATARSEMLYAILVEGAGPLGLGFQPR